MLIYFPINCANSTPGFALAAFASSYLRSSNFERDLRDTNELMQPEREYGNKPKRCEEVVNLIAGGVSVRRVWTTASPIAATAPQTAACFSQSLSKSVYGETFA
jgi:hypothetical protein